MGLLADLDAKLATSDIGSLIGGAAGSLTDVEHTVSTLTEGLPALTRVIDLLDDPPQPPGLDGLESLEPALVGARDGIPSDFEGPLAPILSPLRRLADTGGGASAAQIMASLELFRETVQLVGGRLATGAAGVPGGPNLFGAQGMPEGETVDLELLRQQLQQVETSLDAFGDRLDAQRFIELMRQAGPMWSRLRHKWPSLPVLGDMMESVHTVVRWEVQTPAQLTASLQQTLTQTARLIAAPYDRVALGVVQTASTAADAGPTLQEARGRLEPLLARLAHKVTTSGHQPSPRELSELDRALIPVERLAEALDLEGSPLARVEDLPSELNMQLVRTLRALGPSVDVAALQQRVQAMVARIPDPDPDPMAEVVQAIEDLDLSMITGPLGSIKDVVDDAVAEVQGAMNDVRQALLDVLQPVADALQDAVTTMGIQDIRTALEDLPATIQAFVDDEVRPKLDELQGGVEGAVQAVSGAVDDFDPEAIKDQLRAAIEDAASVLQSDEIRSTFEQVETTLEEAVGSLQSLDLAPAADESIELIENLEGTLSEIDPSSIPDAAKPLLDQTLAVVRDINLTADVSTPLLEEARKALSEGPERVLDQLERLLGEVRARLEQFKPSVVVGSRLQDPFDQLMATLEGFQPSDLLDQVDQALSRMADQLHVVDPDEVVGPLDQLHQEVLDGIAAIHPDQLLTPVDEAIQDAIAKLFETTGLDDVFDGIRNVVDDIRDYVDLLDQARGGLKRIAQRLEDPGEIEAAIESMADGAVARLDAVDIADLRPALAEGQAAVGRIERGRIAAEVAGALRAASEHTPDALRGTDTGAVRALARDFPRTHLGRLRQTPSRVRLGRLLDRLDRVTVRIDAAVDPWHAASSSLATVAGSIHGELAPYERMLRVDGEPVLTDFATPPNTMAAIKMRVREALVESLRFPTTVSFEIFRAVAPHVAGLSRGLSRIITAVHGKLDGIMGDEGVSGVVASVESTVDTLKNLDLSPLRDPLTTQIYQPLEQAVAALDPEPLRAGIEAAKMAIQDLLQLSTLIDPTTIEQADTTYAAVVDKLKQLSPQVLLTDSLDPVYMDLVGSIDPVLELPAKLRTLLETADRELKGEIREELQRVETAFDRMLNALPVSGSGGSVSGLASASLSA